MEQNAKQQQELSQRTMRELKEHLDRVMLENTQKEQLILALKKERDRLNRENQAMVRNKALLCQLTHSNIIIVS
jgi:hypothetical protein